MRTFFAALLLGVIALMSLPVPLPAQHMAQDDGELERSFHYVPPSARQSVEVGNFYFRRKDYRGALSRFEEAARDDPYYAPAYLGLGKVYERPAGSAKPLPPTASTLTLCPHRSRLMKRRMCTRPSARWSSNSPASRSARRSQSNHRPLQKSELLGQDGAFLVQVGMKNLSGAVSVLFQDHERNFQDRQHLRRSLAAEDRMNSARPQKVSRKVRVQ